jgi:phage-related protein
LVQIGKTPKSGKGLRGVTELRKRFDGNTYRTVYIAKLANKVYVLHCFQKKSKSSIKTPKTDIELIKTRLKIAVQDSKGEKKK